jgi:hypothetical protein
MSIANVWICGLCGKRTPLRSQSSRAEHQHVDRKIFFGQAVACGALEK